MKVKMYSKCDQEFDEAMRNSYIRIVNFYTSQFKALCEDFKLDIAARERLSYYYDRAVKDAIKLGEYQGRLSDD